MTTYKYEPLKANTSEFRLVTLLPGNWDDEIRCTLTTRLLETKPKYHALSYTWGDPSNTVPIQLDDIEFRVTNNLAVALRYLRLGDRPYTIWIDAICINQHDLGERSAQVRRIRDIYVKSDKVVAWTGESDEHSEAALDLIEEIARLFDLHLELDEGLAFTPEIDAKMGSHITNKNWGALWNFWGRDYWSRVWILQKLISSGYLDVSGDERCIVRCGNRLVPGLTAARSCSFVGLLNMAEVRFLISQDVMPEPWASVATRGTPPALHMHSAVATCLLGSFDRLSIPDLMMITAGMNATDDRDKIYAISGLSDEAADLIDPDYTQSVAQAHMNLVKAAVERRGNLDTITHNCSDNFGAHPSWIFQGHFLPDVGVGWHLKRDLYKASAGRMADAKFNIEERLLSATGLKVDTIRCTVGPFRTLTAVDVSTGRIATDLSRDIRFANRHLWGLIAGMRDVMNDDQKEVLWRTLVLDADYRNVMNIVVPAPAYLELQHVAFFSATEHVGEGARSTNMASSGPLLLNSRPDLPAKEVDLHPIEDYLKAIGHAMAERCFFRTLDQRLMGVGPKHVQEGDILALLYGSDHLFVLRPKGDHYILIGNAYAHGCMHGELLGEAGKDCVEQVFTLC